MHSVPSPSASKPQISDYTRIRARSIRFLILLAAVLALAFFLSLRAGSYNTPAAELIRGIFGRAADNKINLVIRNNRLPRICTAMVSGAGLAGAALLLLSDLVARVVIMPVILPIGALTAFLGGPLFLYLLFKGRRQT